MEESLRRRIEIRQGDITKLAVDAIVNAANTLLLGGVGVDGAIHRVAGPGLLTECKGIGGCPTGEARLTKGYKLPAKYVIHTVGPVYRGQPEDSRLLASCYQESLALADTHGVRSIVFPAISCGVYGYPVADACRIAVDSTVLFLKDHEQIQRVFFMLFSDENRKVYDDYLAGT